ncbi:MAG: hypothetical protein ACXABY_03635 [Candidatus Thorarchaeota archaeon]
MSKEKVRGVLLALLLLVMLLYCPSNASAIETRHGGGFGPVDIIQSSNITYWTFNGHGGPLDNLDMQTLYEAGVKTILIIHWWVENISNTIDIYYNSTVQSYLDAAIDFNLAAFDPDYVWGVTLGDEQYISSQLTPEIVNYNDTYYAETGYWMKPPDKRNTSEFFAYNEWLNEKSVWAYNHIASYVRAWAPNAKIIQYVLMPPNWGLGDKTCATYELDGDVFAVDCYYANDVYMLLYESVRRYKASLPGKSIHFDIWGTIWDFINEAGDGFYYEEGSYEQIRRETWLSYLSGVDALGYFDWAPQYNDSFDWTWGHQREDELGKKLWMYIDNLAGQLSNLPTLNSSPEVLVVGDGHQTGAAMLNVAELGLFTEYDLVNQRCFATTDVNMSHYSLVLLADDWYYDDTVDKLNSFVSNGGNLVFLEGINSTDVPLPRYSKFSIEYGCKEEIFSGHVFVNITEPNILELEIVDYDAPSHGTRLLNISSGAIGYTPIEGFYSIEDETLKEIENSPLTLYHNESETDSGWVLYIGAEWSYADSEGPSDQKPHLWYLYREFIRAFADFLNITNSISTNETENMLITQGIVGDGLLLAGISNFNNTLRSINYTLDLSQFGFPDGNYWVHSLDSNFSLGQYTSENSILEIRIDVVANGTRLLLISEAMPKPGYSIDIFPEIPEYVPVTTTTTTTTETVAGTTTSTSPTETPTTPPPDYIYIYAITSGIVLSGLILVIAIVSRRRRKT